MCNVAILFFELYQFKQERDFFSRTVKSGRFLGGGAACVFVFVFVFVCVCVFVFVFLCVCVCVCVSV